jgi:hypothetical protein
LLPHLDKRPLLSLYKSGSINYTATRLIDSPTYVNPPIHPATNSRAGIVWGGSDE